MPPQGLPLKEIQKIFSVAIRKWRGPKGAYPLLSGRFLIRKKHSPAPFRK
jgi:hypothetical protein